MLGEWRHILARRRVEPEWMDQPGLEARLHQHALRGLARLNRFSRAVSILWPPIAHFAGRHQIKNLRVLDLASGGGDNAIQLFLKARDHGLTLEIIGWDRSAHAIEHSRARAAARGVPVVFERHDALVEPIAPGFEVIMSSLFLHHLDEAQALGLLAKMRQAAPGLILISDLRRGRAGLVLACAASKLLTTSEVVRNDAPASVRAAFTISEALHLARRAGMEEATVKRRWPCRFLLAWSCL